MPVLRKPLKHALNLSFTKYQAYLWEPGKLENEKATWPTALAYCNSIGMDLATVADEDEYLNLREYVMQYHRCMKKGDVHTSS